MGEIASIKRMVKNDVNQRNIKRGRQIESDVYQKLKQTKKCRACGKENIVPEIHHIVSKNSGGSNEEGNLVNLCFECHQKVHQYNVNRLMHLIDKLDLLSSVVADKNFKIEQLEKKIQERKQKRKANRRE